MLSKDSRKDPKLILLFGMEGTYTVHHIHDVHPSHSYHGSILAILNVLRTKREIQTTHSMYQKSDCQLKCFSIRMTFCCSVLYHNTFTS